MAKETKRKIPLRTRTNQNGILRKLEEEIFRDCWKILKNWQNHIHLFYRLKEKDGKKCWNQKNVTRKEK